MKKILLFTLFFGISFGFIKKNNYAKQEFVEQGKERTNIIIKDITTIFASLELKVTSKKLFVKLVINNDSNEEIYYPKWLLLNEKLNNDIFYIYDSNKGGYLNSPNI